MSDPFDEVTPPAFRNTDPETSAHAAATATLSMTGDRLRVMEFASRCSDGFIDDDLRTVYINGETLRKRRSDLTKAGYLKDSARRRFNRANNGEVVWVITEKGRAAL